MNHVQKKKKKPVPISIFIRKHTILFCQSLQYNLKIYDDNNVRIYYEYQSIQRRVYAYNNRTAVMVGTEHRYFIMLYYLQLYNNNNSGIHDLLCVTIKTKKKTYIFLRLHHRRSVGQQCKLCVCVSVNCTYTYLYNLLHFLVDQQQFHLVKKWRKRFEGKLF